jgi:Flp pilus assembly protein TadB
MIAGAVVFTHVQEILLTLGLEMGLVLLFIKGAAYLGFGLFYIRQAWALAIGSAHTFFDLRSMRSLGASIQQAIGEPRLARVSAQWWSREEPPPSSTEGDLARLLRVCMGVLVFFTLYSSLYYQPWYLTWSLFFLPFLLVPRYKWHVLSLIVVSVITTLGFVYF